MHTSVAAFWRCLALALSLGAALPAFATILDSIRPSAGGVAGGTTVEIEGDFSDTVTAVTFGGAPAVILRQGTSAITVMAPPGVPGVADVTVFNPFGSATIGSWFTYVNNDDVARDFSWSNPSPRWTHGWTPGRGGAFTAYDVFGRAAGDTWSAGGLPVAFHNYTNSPLTQATNTTPAGGLLMHPGGGSSYAVARWTAPATGTYRIEGYFIGLDFSYPTTTDVAILHNDTTDPPLMSGGIATYNEPLFFSLDRAVSAGDTIDFVVGDGGNGITGDATGLSATITPTAAVIDRLMVTNTNDSGEGSLRDAMDFANFVCSAKLLGAPGARAKVLGAAITFNIPGTGIQTISPLSALPPIQCDNLLIDAFTQPGTKTNGQPVGDDAVRLIELNGSLAPLGANGFEIAGELVTIRGFIINDFAGAAGVMVFTPIGRTGPRILGNVIGTDATGGSRRKNAYGVRNEIDATGIAIGSPALEDRNVISGNSIGIRLQSGDFNVVENNYIGLNVAGSAAQANDRGMIVSGTTNLQLRNNTISGNLGDGVLLGGSTGTIVQGNRIGTDASGSGAVANGATGLSFLRDADAVGQVGGTSSGEGNVIAFNGQHGVRVAPAEGVPILGNSIHSNGGLGIELANSGAVASNDSCDGDSGGNGFQNYPVITSVAIASDYTTVTGTFDSTAGRTYRLEFFKNFPGDPAGNRAGRIFIGSTNVATTLTPSCETPFSTNLSIRLSPGDLVTATATDLTTNSTGWFSAAVAAAAPVTCAIGVSTSVGANTFAVLQAGNSFLVPPSSTAGLQAFCNGGAPINSFAWSTGETTPGITITTPPPGASAPYSVTLETPSGSVSVPITLNSSPAGAPVCAIAPASMIPLPAVNPPQFSVLSSDPSGAPPGSCNTPAGTTYTWSDGTGLSAHLVSGQGNPSATYELSGSEPGRGAFISMTPTNSFGTGPTAVVFVLQSPVDIAPTALVFPATPPVTQSAPQSVVVRNLSPLFSVPLTITSGGPFTMTHNCPSVLPASASCTIDVRFFPAAPGAGQTGAVTVNYQFGGFTQTQAISLSGTSIGAPVVSITPSSLNFAARTVSTTSTAQTVTLANTGTVVLAIASITVSGDFAFTSTCGTTLAPGASCTMDVTFTPLVAGARSGSLTVTDNAAGSPHTVALTGTGLSSAAPVADVSPGALDFAAQAVGSESAADVVTVTNSGNAPLTFVSIGITGDFAVVAAGGAAAAGECPLTLAAGASCEIHVIFRPTAPNLREGVLSIGTNAGTVAVRVIGTGLIPAPPQLSVAASLAFEGQPIGTRSEGRALPILNTSEVLATITELATTGDFEVSDTCTTIAAGAACSPLVTFLPTALGPRTGTLTVRTLRDADPYTVSLTGVGEENRLPVLQLSATSMGFGNTFIGQPVTREVTLRNAGTAPLVITSILAGGGFFADSSCITTIAAGATCTMHVTFLPGSPGGQSSVVEIRSNAAASPHGVNLNGTGCFVPTPSRARLGLLLCGS